MEYGESLMSDCSEMIAPRSISELTAALPPAYPSADLRAQARQALKQRRASVVVLDDDPTGCQTVQDITVLTRWDSAIIAAALATGDPALYILTNSRSLPPSAAVALMREVARQLAGSARLAQCSVELVSRSDSTLRGHFPAEVDALRTAWEAASGERYDGVCLIPAFPEGGRITVDNIHWVSDGTQCIPAAQTPFAGDTAFGFLNSALPAWVEEKTAGRVPAASVASVSLETIRRQGPQGVADALCAAGEYVVINAVDYADLDVVAAGVRLAAARGNRRLFRSAASWVKALAGIPEHPLLAAETLCADRTGGGLIVFGSHVPKSTAQLAAVRALPGIVEIELSVPRIIDTATRKAEIARVATAVNLALAAGREVVLFTSRTVMTGENADANLHIARTVSAALVTVLHRLTRQPRYVLAKGGITAHDVAMRGLNVQAARVLGQLLPGVPVWRLGGDCRWPGVPYIVFPGNVGDTESVAKIVRRLNPSLKE